MSSIWFSYREFINEECFKPEQTWKGLILQVYRIGTGSRCGINFQFKFWSQLRTVEVEKVQIGHSVLKHVYKLEIVNT